MASQSDPIRKLQIYIAKVKETGYPDANVNDDDDYEARINRTLQSLQNQVKQHQEALEKLRAEAQQAPINEPAESPKIRIQQLRTIIAAYKTVTPSEPLLPLPNSPLPALLALRNTLNLVDRTKKSIRVTDESIKKARSRLKQEQTDLQDGRSLTQALETRIQKLKLEHEEQSHQDSRDIVRTLIEKQRQQTTTHNTELRKLVRAFNTFTSTHLAPMLAAEDLGGPTVGSLLDIDDEMLAAGFNAQGKPKKPTSATETKRKRRNDEVWGAENDDSEEERTERETAEKEFRALVEDLLNAAAGEEGDGPYVKVRKEGAAVRFLIRAKVADFKEDDARLIRLVNFGAELDRKEESMDMS